MKLNSYPCWNNIRLLVVDFNSIKLLRLVEKHIPLNGSQNFMVVSKMIMATREQSEIGITWNGRVSLVTTKEWSLSRDRCGIISDS